MLASDEKGFAMTLEKLSTTESFKCFANPFCTHYSLIKLI